MSVSLSVCEIQVYWAAYAAKKMDSLLLNPAKVAINHQHLSRKRHTHNFAYFHLCLKLIKFQSFKFLPHPQTFVKILLHLLNIFWQLVQCSGIIIINIIKKLIALKGVSEVKIIKLFWHFGNCQLCSACPEKSTQTFHFLL